MLSPSDIRPAVEAVLIAADRSLTTYEILNSLPDNLLQQIISERGMPGLGSGNSYSAASLISDSVEGLLPSLEPPYRVYEHRQAVFTVAGQEIHPGNSAIAFYRLNPPPVKIPPVIIQHSSNDETKPVTMIKIPWYDRPWIMAAWLIFFWPVWVYGFYKTTKASKGWKIAITLFILIPMFFSALTSRSGNSTSVPTTSYPQTYVPSDPPVPISYLNMADKFPSNGDMQDIRRWLNDNITDLYATSEDDRKAILLLMRDRYTHLTQGYWKKVSVHELYDTQKKQFPVTFQTLKEYSSMVQTLVNSS